MSETSCGKSDRCMYGRGGIKMTAAEIKNSLEICGTQGKCCLGCAFYNTKTTNCVSELAAAALMLVIDQEKKIEELTEFKNIFSGERFCGKTQSRCL